MKIRIIYKLAAILISVSLLILLTGVFGISSINRIISSVDIVTKEDVPLLRSMREAILAAYESGFWFEKALRGVDYTQIDEIRSAEASFRKDIILFDIFINAGIWGSESEAFARSSGGLILAEWERAGLKGKLIVEKPSPEETQLAGMADLYFGAFSNNAQEAISLHKKFLRLSSQGQMEEAQKIKIEVDKYAEKAREFQNLTIKQLAALAQLTNVEITSEVLNIEQHEDTAKTFLTLVFITAFISAVVASNIFTAKVISNPLKRLHEGAERIGGGDLSHRVDIKTGDEIGELAESFNQMANSLGESYVALEEAKTVLEIKVQSRTRELRELAEGLDEQVRERTRELRERVGELEKFHKLTVGRELKMRELKEEIKRLEEELEKRSTQT